MEKMTESLKEEFRQMINSAEFQTCNISKNFAEYLLTECKKFGFEKESEIIRMKMKGEARKQEGQIQP